MSHQQMNTQFLEYIDHIENSFLKLLLEKIFVNDTKFYELFIVAKGGNVHHSYRGGLLEHTLNVVKLCEKFSTIFPQLNKDLIITVAMLHDIGKVVEYYSGKQQESLYADSGKLLGHICIGFDQVSKVIASIPHFPRELEFELKHCLLAHHGELEFGSPKRPALLEAQALYYADTVDSKLQLMEEILEKNTDKNHDWTEYNEFFGSELKRTKGILNL